MLRWMQKLLRCLCCKGLRRILQRCRNLLRLPQGRRGWERPKVRTVRQLAAAAGDGLVGPARSPGRPETSLTLASSWASCDSYSCEAHTFVEREWARAERPERRSRRVLWALDPW